MLGNYSNFEGLQAFSRAFRSATYNSSGASMYSVLDSSKKYATVGKRMIGFSRPDSVALKERNDAETYGVGLTDFYQKVAKEQVEAPDAVEQPKYTGGSGEPVAEAVGEMPPKEVVDTDGEVDVDAIDIGEYEDLSEDQAKTMKNRVAAIKSIPEFEGMEVKLVRSKTKSSVAIYVPSQAIKKALIIHYALLLQEMPEGNSKRLVKYLAGGAAFKIKESAPMPQFTPRKKEPTARKSKATPASVGGGGSSPAPTSATTAMTKALESEGGTETPKRTIGKPKVMKGSLSL